MSRVREKIEGRESCSATADAIALQLFLFPVVRFVLLIVLVRPLYSHPHPLCHPFMLLINEREFLIKRQRKIRIAFHFGRRFAVPQRKAGGMCVQRRKLDTAMFGLLVLYTQIT